MKHKALLVFLLAAAAAAHGQAPAQVSILQPQPMISTEGSAEIHIKPDLADLSFDIEIRNIDLAAARKQLTAISTKLLAALRVAGIAEEDLQASQLTISPTWNERHGIETATVRFYSVSQTFSCTLHDVDKVPDITSAAIAAGATSVSPAVLRISDLRKYRDQARVEAIRAAKEKASALTGELGVKVGKPYMINEYNPYHSWGAANMSLNSNTIQQNGNFAAGDSKEAVQPAFAPGMITVTANVEVTFYLE